NLLPCSRTRRLASSSPGGRTSCACEVRVTAGGWLCVLCTSAVSAGQFSGPVRLAVHAGARSVTVASYRLQSYLDTQNCTAELVFNQAGDGDGDLDRKSVV